MKNKIFTVHAYRWGDRELHSYSVGVFRKKAKALKEAEDHKTHRGGKYECEVIMWDIDDPSTQRTVLDLPKINTLKQNGQK